jgi:PBP1b-binding outer membrane lipoprotein LpoB
MKHAILIFSLIFALVILPGCATRATMTTPEYENALNENIEYLKSWRDNLNKINANMYESIYLIEQFREQYQTEEVIASTDEFLESTWSFSSSIISDVKLAEAYITLYAEYKRGSTANSIEDLWRATTHTIRIMDTWKIAIPLWIKNFDELTAMMFKYGFITDVE